MLRELTDERGVRWEVSLGKESWGTLVLLFAPRSGGGVRKSVLASETARAASAELDAMSDDELRVRLASSVLWA